MWQVVFETWLFFINKEQVMKKSWRTTVLGVIAGMALILAQATNVLDDDPETVFSLSQLLAGIGALGIGWFARDNGVTSETAGAK